MYTFLSVCGVLGVIAGVSIYNKEEVETKNTDAPEGVEPSFWNAFQIEQSVIFLIFNLLALMQKSLQPKKSKFFKNSRENSRKND